MIVAIDTETTGLGHKAKPRRADGIVEVGTAWRDQRNRLQTWSSLCMPDRKYLEGGRTEKAFDISGITEKEILGAPKDTLVAKSLKKKLEDIGQASGKQIRLTAYNVDFDAPFLSKKPWKIPRSMWGKCSMMLATGYFDECVSLSAALKRLRLRKPKGSFHNAKADAAAALLVYERLSGNTLRKRMTWRALLSKPVVMINVRSSQPQAVPSPRLALPCDI